MVIISDLQIFNYCFYKDTFLLPKSYKNQLKKQWLVLKKTKKQPMLCDKVENEKNMLKKIWVPR